MAAGRQYIALVRLGDRQAILSEQAGQTEAKLQAMVMDVLALSKTNTTALAIVAKHGIRYTPAAAPSPDLPLGSVLPESGPRAKAAP